MIEDFTHKVDKPFHSSGYAEVASGASMGATSAQSFQQRYSIDRNRQYVPRYHVSHLANAPSERPTRTTDEMNGNERRGYGTPKPIVVPPRVQQPHRFSEPGGRGYNPYG